jgi:phage-related protein
VATNIGRVEYLVGADGKILEPELRRIGQRAGKASGRAAGKEFSKAFDGQLSDGGAKSLSSWRAVMTKQGRNNGLLFGESWYKSSMGVIKRRAKNAMQEVAEVFTFDDGSWERMARRFDSVTNAIGHMEEQLRTAHREGGLTANMFDILIERNKQYGAAALKVEEAQKALNKAWDEAKAEDYQRALAERNRLLERQNTLTRLARERTERFRQGVEDLNQAMGSSRAFRRYVTDVGGVDNAMRNLDIRITEVARSADDTTWMSRQRRRLLDLGFAFESSAESSKKSERNIGGSHRRIRSHVGRTIAAWTALVLIIGEGTATLGSGLGASITALASSFALAIGGMAAILAPFLGTIITAIPFFNSFWTALSAEQGIDIMKEINLAFKDAGSAIAEALVPNVRAFIDALKDLASNESAIAGMTRVFGALFDGLTAGIESPGFQKFLEALDGPIGKGFENLGTVIGNVIDGLSAFSAAVSPLFEAITERLAEWSENWAEAMNIGAEEGGFLEWMALAEESIVSVMDFVGSLIDVLGTLFMAGAPTGNSMLDTLTGLLDKWNEWMQTVEGQQTLQEWFTQGEIIFNALIGFLGQLGQMFGDLVTPESVERLVNFLEGLGEFLPIAGQILEFFGRLDILNIFVSILNIIGDILGPMMPVLLTLASLLGETLVNALQDLREPAGKLGDALKPILERFVDLLVRILPPLIDVIITTIDVIVEWITFILNVGTAVGELTGYWVVFRSYITVVVSAITTVISGFQIFIKGMVRFVSQLLQGDFSGAFKTARDTIGKVFDKIGDFVDTVKDVFRDLLNASRDIIGRVGDVFGNFSDRVGEAFGGVGDWISGAIGWFNDLFNAASSASGAVSGAQSASGGGRGRLFAASGMMVTRRSTVTVGEDGPEAIVPLRRSLSRVSPDVRWLSAIAQGRPQMASGGIVGRGGVNVGDIHVSGVEDPNRAANEVVQRIFERVGG